MTVLVLLLLVAGVSSVFVWFMNQQQTQTGLRYRHAAALAIAEAGVYRALEVLESTAPDGTLGRYWRPDGYAEEMRAGPLRGRFTVSLADGPRDSLVATSTGDVAGVRRRLRAEISVASPALLAALYGRGFVRLEQSPATTFIAAYGAEAAGLPWIHIAAGRGIWIGARDVSINDPGQTLVLEPGPGDPAIPGGSAPALPAATHLRFWLPRGAELVLGPERRPVDLAQLRAAGTRIDGAVVWSAALPEPPEIDVASLKALAAGNMSNARINEAAGRLAGDTSLAQKQDGLYMQGQFDRVLGYLAAGSRAQDLSGVVYVRGSVSVSDGLRLSVADGTLVAEGGVTLGRGASLEVVHSRRTRTLPGLVVLDRGSLILGTGARLRVHGLVYVDRVFLAYEGASADIIGSIICGDERLSFNSAAASLAIRYDAAVLSTQGLRAPRTLPIVARVVEWQELP